MERITRSANTICKVLKVLFWVIAVGCGITLIAIPALLLAGNRVPPIWDSAISLGNYTLQLSQPYTLSQLAPLFSVTLVNAVLLGGLCCYTIRILLDVFRAMAKGQPFSTPVSCGLSKLSWAVLVLGAIRLVLEVVTNYIFYDTFAVASLFAQDRVAACSISVVGDGSFLIWFFLLRLLRRIFQYGEALQQLSDETL